MWEAAGGWGPAVAGEPPQGESLPEEETPVTPSWGARPSSSALGPAGTVRPRQAVRPERRGAAPWPWSVVGPVTHSLTHSGVLG